MIRITLTFVSFLLLTSCVNHANDDMQLQLNINDSMRNAWDSADVCNNFWREETNKWMNVNGENFESVSSVRHLIANDDITLLSKLVRTSWFLQKDSGFSENITNIGRWPVTDSEYRAAAADIFLQNLKLYLRSVELHYG